MVRTSLCWSLVLAALTGACPAWGADPLVVSLRDTYPSCSKSPPAEDVEAAKGLHEAARRHFELGEYEAARRRWKEAYALDCSAHRLLLNVANCRQREGNERAAWAARALYVERAGDDADPTIVTRVAREHPPKAYRPRPLTSAANLDVVLWPTRGAGNVFVFEASAKAALTRDLLVELELPWALWIDPGALADPRGNDVDDARAGVGNPHLSAFYTPRWFSGGIAVGGRLGAPWATIDDVDAQATAGIGGDARGWTDLRQWAAARLPLSATAALDQRVAGPFSVQADLTSTAFIPLGRGAYRFDDRSFDVAIAGGAGIALDFEVHKGATVGGDAGVSIVYVPTFEGDDAQATLRFGVAYRSEEILVRAGTRWGLDGPLGWAFDDGRLATFTLSLGVPLPGLADRPGPATSLASGD